MSELVKADAVLRDLSDAEVDEAIALRHYLAAKKRTAECLDRAAHIATHRGDPMRPTPPRMCRHSMSHSDKIAEARALLRTHTDIDGEPTYSTIPSALGELWKNLANMVDLSQTILAENTALTHAVRGSASRDLISLNSWRNVKTSEPRSA